MSVFKHFSSSDPIQHYINKFSLRLTKEQAKLIERTMQIPGSIMLGSADEAQLFQLLLKSTSAKRVLELGTFTGYTTMSMALALPADGFIVTCDLSDKYIAFDIWKEAGVDHKIQVTLGPAVETLKKMLKSGMEDSFDFAFIDADKENYIEYYELCLKLVRPGGMIAIDNVLWGGAVADYRVQDSSTKIIRKLNEIVRNDSRVFISMLQVGDGTTLCLKK